MTTEAGGMDGAAVGRLGREIGFQYGSGHLDYFAASALLAIVGLTEDQIAEVLSGRQPNRKDAAGE